MMPCTICNDVGMVRTQDIESGGWEVCPQCYPPKQLERSWLGRLWRMLLARYRLDLKAVCEESKGKGMIDYHDYPDDKHGSWMCHMVELECTRCGKRFTV